MGTDRHGERVCFAFISARLRTISIKIKQLTELYETFPMVSL